MLHPTEPNVINHLRQLRRHQGLPLYGLAVRAHVSPTIIGMVERWDYRPGPKVRQRIAAALGVAVADIWPERESAA
jgi:lambda repressor-like predicted transcriptional regulator